MQPQPNQKIYEMPDPGKLSAASGRALKDLSAFFAKEGVCALLTLPPKSMPLKS